MKINFKFRQVSCCGSGGMETPGKELLPVPAVLREPLVHAAVQRKDLEPRDLLRRVQGG